MGEGCIELEKVLELHTPDLLITPSCLSCTPKEKKQANKQKTKTTWHQAFMAELSEAKLALGEAHHLTPNIDK